MSELAIVVEAMLPILIVAGLGVGLRRVGWLTSAADASLLTLTVNVLTPCLILDKVLGSAALTRASTLLLAPAIGFGVVAISIAVAFVAAHAGGIRAEPARRTFALATGLQNYGYFPLPLALSLFGNDTAAVLFVHNLGVEVAIWTLGIAVLTGAPFRNTLRRLASPPAVAILVAVTLNACVDREQVPPYLVQSVSLVGSAAIPLGLLPLLYCAALWGLDASVELQQVFVLQAAMPAAVIPIILAKHHGGDSITALRVVFATTLGALVTIPLWIHFGSRWVGSH